MRKLYAEMWSCGNEECDCTQPQILERSTEPFRHPLWKGPDIIAQGTVCSNADSQESAMQWGELLTLAEAFNVENLDSVKQEYQKRYS